MPSLGREPQGTGIPKNDSPGGATDSCLRREPQDLAVIPSEARWAEPRDLWRNELARTCHSIGLS
jgi:hypothetical protein